MTERNYGFLVTLPGSVTGLLTAPTCHLLLFCLFHSHLIIEHKQHSMQSILAVAKRVGPLRGKQVLLLRRCSVLAAFGSSSGGVPPASISDLLLKQSSRTVFWLPPAIFQAASDRISLTGCIGPIRTTPIDMERARWLLRNRSVVLSTPRGSWLLLFLEKL